MFNLNLKEPAPSVMQNNLRSSIIPSLPITVSYFKFKVMDQYLENYYFCENNVSIKAHMTVKKVAKERGQKNANNVNINPVMHAF